MLSVSLVNSSGSFLVITNLNDFLVKDVPNGVTPVATAGGEEIEVSGIQW